MVGLSESDWLALPSAEQARILARGKALLQSSGAHYVAASVAECLPILYEIEGRIERGSVLMSTSSCKTGAAIDVPKAVSTTAHSYHNLCWRSAIRATTSAVQITQ